MCSICKKLDEYIEIDNDSNCLDDEKEFFPDAYLKLEKPNNILGEKSGLLKCPECGQYYWHKTWTPGGSEDAFHSYHYESIKKVSAGEVYFLLNEVLEVKKRLADEYKDDKDLSDLFVPPYLEFKKTIDEELTFTDKEVVDIVKKAVNEIKHKYKGYKQQLSMLDRLYPKEHESNLRIAASEKLIDEEKAILNIILIEKCVKNILKLPDNILFLLNSIKDDELVEVRKIVGNLLNKKS